MGPENEFQILPEVTPHQRLLGKILGREQEPISKAREEELRNILDGAIEGIRGSYQVVLGRRFGLRGNPRETLVQIAQSFGVGKQRIYQIERAGIIKLRGRLHRERIPIMEYLSIPSGSVARRIADLPLTTKGEFKIFEGMDLSELEVAYTLVRNVGYKGGGGITDITDVLLDDAKSYIDQLSPNQIRDLKALLDQIYQKAQARQRLNTDRERGLLRERIKFTIGFESDEKKSGLEGRRQAEGKQKNVFMPGLPEEIKSKIWHESLDNLSLSVRTRNCLGRAGIKTIGAILAISADFLVIAIRGFGVISLRELQDALADHVGILQEKA